jgi:cell division protein FtsB
MTYEFRFRIVELLRTSRRALLPAIIALAALYFGLYAVFGPKGFYVLVAQEKTHALAAAELAMLEEEQAALERRVRLLNGTAIDPDLLEEEARRVLNRAHPDDVIVLMPPPAVADTAIMAPPVETER